MDSLLITVVETVSFISGANSCMADAERAEAISMIAANPECGDVISGGGGIRKVRFAIGTKGKSGGVRIIYYFHNERVPIFLLRYLPKMTRRILPGWKPTCWAMPQRCWLVNMGSEKWRG